jgi:glycosyltransferase involved in cell wall biosynthesis
MQTYHNLEIICIDDASPDACYNILKNYAALDTRIKILTKDKNEGLSAARNDDLALSSGEYIYFLDSDDWIEDTRIEIMLSALIENNLDIVYNDVIYEIWDGIRYKHAGVNKVKCAGYISHQYAGWMVPTYMFKKDFLNNYTPPFPVGLRHEDTYFYAVVIRNLPKVYAVISGAYYYYRDNPTSIMTPKINKYVEDYDIIEILRLIFEYYRSQPIGEKVAMPLSELYSYLSVAADINEFLHRQKILFSEMIIFMKLHKHLYDKFDIEMADMILKSHDNDNNILEKLQMIQRKKHIHNSTFLQLRAKIRNIA